MCSAENAIAADYRSSGVKGWLYHGDDGKQMTYWVCLQDGHSEQHMHDFDEYMLVISGKYTLCIDGRHIELSAGDEYHISAGVAHSGEFLASTRTIHCFAGTRAVYAK